mmetsp:Transcript_13191/g.33220  ORF Transcript_13191/g.33220 Transcript_13191/m.33220 type:complete len:240 (-) Transcript_13191:242-961(-)
MDVIDIIGPLGRILVFDFFEFFLPFHGLRGGTVNLKEFSEFSAFPVPGVVCNVNDALSRFAVYQFVSGCVLAAGKGRNVGHVGPSYSRIGVGIHALGQIVELEQSTLHQCFFVVALIVDVLIVMVPKPTLAMLLWLFFFFFFVITRFTLIIIGIVLVVIVVQCVHLSFSFSFSVLIVERVFLVAFVFRMLALSGQAHRMTVQLIYRKDQQHHGKGQEQQAIPQSYLLALAEPLAVFIVL